MANPDRDAILARRQALISRALEGLREAMRVNAEAGERVATLVRSMQSFAGLDEAEIKKVDLHAGIDSAIELVRHRAGERVRIERRYGELPEIAVYAGRINQLFLNLLTNAVQAIEHDGQVTIETRYDPDRNEVTVAVRDDGRGIAPERLEHIFEPGYTTKKGVGVGLGLGLSIAYRVAREHGGRIAVQSEPGAGSTFTVTLPRDHVVKPK